MNFTMNWCVNFKSETTKELDFSMVGSLGNDLHMIQLGGFSVCKRGIYLSSEANIGFHEVKLFNTNRPLG